MAHACCGGGEETQVLESVLGFSFDVTKNGIYFLDRAGVQLAAASLPGANGLSISPDGLTLIRGQTTETGADLIVMEKIRYLRNPHTTSEGGFSDAFARQSVFATRFIGTQL